MLLCTAAAAILLFRHRDRLRRWRRRESLRYVLAGILFVNMTMFYGVFVIKGVYDWHIHLPLHFCFISGFLFMAVLASGSRKWFGAVYFFTWAGPLPAMIWPNTPTRFDRYLTYPFFISHHLLLLAGLYCLIVLRYRVEKRDLRRAFLWGNAIFAAVFLFNQLFGTNYIMTGQLPAHILGLFPSSGMSTFRSYGWSCAPWQPSRRPISRFACCVGWTGTNGASSKPNIFRGGHIEWTWRLIWRIF